MFTSRIQEKLGFGVARVLVADDDPATRLAIQTVLEAGGYDVDSAASAAEAVGKMDEEEYELVLADLDMETPDSGLKVIAHARMMDYQPAAAVVHTEKTTGTRRGDSEMLVAPENLPEFLTQVAYLIGSRASRRLQRQMRSHAVAAG